jgi:hypothetical protein
MSRVRADRTGESWRHFLSHESPLASAITCTFEIMGTTPKSKVASVLVGSRCARYDDARFSVWPARRVRVRAMHRVTGRLPAFFVRRSAKSGHNRPVVGRRNSLSISAKRASIVGGVHANTSSSSNMS